MPTPLDDAEVSLLFLMTLVLVTMVLPWYIRRRNPMDSNYTFSQARLAERTYEECFNEVLALSRQIAATRCQNTETYIELQSTLPAPLNPDSKEKSKMTKPYY